MNKWVLGGRYELVVLLGHSGTTAVWAARDQVLNHRVAVRVLRNEGRDTSGTQREIFRALGGLNHAGVEKVFDLGRTSDDDTMYVVTKFLIGQDLRSVLDGEGPPEVDTAVDWAAQIAAALQVVHSVGVVHRNLKPGNLMLAPEGGITLFNFGIATSVAATEPDRIVGTPAYMAPERFEGSSADTRSDLYSLGCVLYELLTGQHPFPGNTPITAAVRAARTPAPIPPSRIRPGIPPALDDLVLDLLAKDPARRPVSAGEVRYVLRELLDADSREADTHPSFPRAAPSADACAHAAGLGWWDVRIRFPATVLPRAAVQAASRLFGPRSTASSLRRLAYPLLAVLFIVPITAALFLLLRALPAAHGWWFLALWALLGIGAVPGVRRRHRTRKPTVAAPGRTSPRPGGATSTLRPEAFVRGLLDMWLPLSPQVVADHGALPDRGSDPPSRERALSNVLAVQGRTYRRLGQPPRRSAPDDPSTEAGEGER
ncbi:serine/threonine-protein kinase [Embleya sp. NPDC055664]